MNATIAEWLAKAAGDFATAEREMAVTASPNYDAVCLHAQQSIEKLMKATLISAGARAPRIHDLVALGQLVTANYPAWNWAAPELDDLSRGAVDMRYPGDVATVSDARNCLDTCRRIRPTLLALLP